MCFLLWWLQPVELFSDIKKQFRRWDVLLQHLSIKISTFKFIAKNFLWVQQVFIYFNLLTEFLLYVPVYALSDLRPPTRDFTTLHELHWRTVYIRILQWYLCFRFSPSRPVESPPSSPAAALNTLQTEFILQLSDVPLCPIKYVCCWYPCLICC